MRKIVVSEFMSLDGVIQAPGGATEDTDGGFAHGGWTHPYWHDDIGTHFVEAMGESDAMLLGRRTWQGHGAAFEPMPAGDPFGDLMNTMPKYVVSTTLATAGDGLAPAATGHAEQGRSCKTSRAQPQEVAAAYRS